MVVSRSSPDRRVAQQPPQQPDLSCMSCLVLRTPKERPQLCFDEWVRLQDGLFQFGFVQTPEFPKHLLMHTVEHGANLGLAGILGGVGIGHGVSSELAKEFL